MQRSGGGKLTDAGEEGEEKEKRKSSLCVVKRGIKAQNKA